MLRVENILDAARTRLALVNQESPVYEAAEILVDPDKPLVVVCDGEGVVVGVISRTDIVKLLACAKSDALSACADAIMTRSILSCREHQPLQEVWEALSARSLRCAPVLDDGGRPLGIVHARDLACALLEEVTHEELLLRDYVLGIGYQ